MAEVKVKIIKSKQIADLNTYYITFLIVNRKQKKERKIYNIDFNIDLILLFLIKEIILGIPGVLLYPFLVPEKGIFWAGNTYEAWLQVLIKLIICI